MQLTWTEGHPPKTLFVNEDDVGGIQHGVLPQGAHRALQALRESGFRDAVIEADADQPFAQVVAVITLLRRCGIEGIRFASPRAGFDPPRTEAGSPVWKIRGLPRASTAELSTAREGGWIEVALDEDGRGRVTVPGKAPVATDPDKLVRGVSYHARRVQTEAGGGRSGLIVRIRADRQTPYGPVRWVVARCADAGVARVEFVVESAEPARAAEAPPDVDPASVRTWVLRAHLPTADEEAPDPEGGAEALASLPIRLTLMRSRTTLQTKVYVGQHYAGVVEQGGLERAQERVRDIVASATVLAEVDSEGTVPYRQVVETVEMLRRGGIRRTTYAAAPPDPPTEAPPPPDSRECEIPEAEAPVPFQAPHAASAEVFVLRNGSYLWSGPAADGVRSPPRPAAPRKLREALSDAARRLPADNRASYRLSAGTILVHADREVPWRFVQHVFQECAAMGFWRIELAVRRRIPRGK